MKKYETLESAKEVFNTLPANEKINLCAGICTAERLVKEGIDFFYEIADGKQGKSHKLPLEIFSLLKNVECVNGIEPRLNHLDLMVDRRGMYVWVKIDCFDCVSVKVIGAGTSTEIYLGYATKIALADIAMIYQSYLDERPITAGQIKQATTKIVEFIQDHKNVLANPVQPDGWQATALGKLYEILEQVSKSDIKAKQDMRK